MDCDMMMDTIIEQHDNVCEMDIVPHYERTQDAWPSELHKWVDMIKYSIQYAFDIALKGDDSRKSLLDQIMKGIELTPIIIDKESQKFVTIDGSEFKNFGHDETEELAARVIHVCDESCGLRVIVLVPDASVSLPWCDLVRIVYKPVGELVSISIHEIKCNRELDTNRLGTRSTKDKIINYAKLGERLRIPLSKCIIPNKNYGIDLVLTLMEEMEYRVYRLGNVTVTNDGIVVRYKNSMKVTDINNSYPMVAYL